MNIHPSLFNHEYRYHDFVKLDQIVLSDGRRVPLPVPVQHLQPEVPGHDREFESDGRGGPGAGGGRSGEPGHPGRVGVLISEGSERMRYGHLFYKERQVARRNTEPFPSIEWVTASTPSLQ